MIKGYINIIEPGGDIEVISASGIIVVNPLPVVRPLLVSTEVPADGLTIELTYDMLLDTASVPATGAFSLSGTSSVINSVRVSGLAVTLGVDTAIFDTDVVTLDYTAGDDPIQDVSGNNAANLTGEAVTNNSEVSAINNNFEILVDTTKAGSASDTMIIPTIGAGFDCTVDWGDGNSDSYSDTPGLTTIQHTYDTGGEKTIKISGTFPRIYFNNAGDKLKLLSVINWGTYGEGVDDQGKAFYGCSNNTSIADDWKLDDVLTNGYAMFSSNLLTSLPSGMELPLLTDGGAMFLGNSFESLPSGMELPLLTNGSYMFYNNSLESLPSGMELPLLTNGYLMFYNNSLTSLPSGMELPELTNGTSMFLNNTIATVDYSRLLVDMEAANSNTGVSFHGGNSKYNATGEVARDALLARDPAWSITDGGLDT